MKKLFAVLVAVAAMSGLASTASATITSPGVGGAVTASGNVTLRGNIISTACALSVGGTVTSTRTVSINSVTFSGCGSGASIVALIASRGAWVKTINLSPRTFTITNVNVQLTAAIGTCLYSGSLSGTYVPGNPTQLTVTSASFTLQPGGSPLCSTRPTVTATLRANATTI